MGYNTEISNIFHLQQMYYINPKNEVVDIYNILY